MSIFVYLLLILTSIYICSVIIRSINKTSEGFVAPISPCNTINATQPSYGAAECTMYKNMFEPIYNNLTKDTSKSDFIIAYNNYKLSRSGQTYIDTYDAIVDKFIGFHNEIFKFIGVENMSLPDSYNFTVPAALKSSDYSPGIATWTEASSNGNAFRCVEYTTNEKNIVESLRKLNGILDNGKQVSTTKENICKSKGYFVQTAKRECGACDNGCCMPYVKTGSESVDEIEAEPTIKCPKPKVRPFQIPPRQISLRVIPPKVKQLTECFEGTAEFHRDISQIIKSDKYEQLQQIPLH
jgi:hypothetical protein